MTERGVTCSHSTMRSCDARLGRFRGEERDTAGDGFFATFDGPARAIRAGQAIITGLAELDLEARIGIHVGECELHEGKLSGIAVNIGARVAATASAGEVIVSSTVRDLVAGSGLTFEDRGGESSRASPNLGSSMQPAGTRDAQGFPIPTRRSVAAERGLLRQGSGVTLEEWDSAASSSGIRTAP